MKSKFVDKYNHDDQANRYDDDVQNESNPVRAGYIHSEGIFHEAPRNEPPERMRDK